MGPKLKIVPANTQPQPAPTETHTTTYTVVEDRKPIARLPPVPQGVISDETAHRMMRGMLQDRQVVRGGVPAAVVFATVVVAGALIGGVAMIIAWIVRVAG